MRILACLLGIVLSPLLVADELISIADPPATLTVWNREIVTFRATIAGMTPEERLAETTHRMRTLPEFARYQQASRSPVQAGSIEGFAFEIDDNRLFVLVREDLEPTEARSFEEVAGDTLERIEDLRRAWLDQRSAGVILKGVGLSILATAVFGLVLYLLRGLGGVLRRFFVRRAARLKRLKRRDLDLRPLLLQLTRRLVGLLVTLLALAAGYLWITYLLGRFPITAGWSNALGDQLTTLGGRFLERLLASIPGFLMVVLIFFLTRGTVRVVDQLLASFEQSEDEDEVLGKDTARATRRIAGLMIWIAGIIIAYPYIPGSDSPAFKGIGVLLGLMVSIGSSGFVNQLMSGFVVLYSGAVRSGEFVRVGEIEGTVSEIGLLSTRVRTARREFVSVPNAVLISRETFNFTRRDAEGLCEFSTAVTIGYDAPWRRVHELLLGAAARTRGIRDQPPPRVLQTALSDFYVEYELRFVPADPSHKGQVLSDLHQQIQDGFHDAGLQIMSPHFESQPDQPVLPPAESA